ncbi:hypothetical protein BT93_B1514 [Corymbia citriodora subsp. variegata]|nr:hypothetical protein BT93_B1514 [Corymbia citriodora subsp. variegata]
MAGTTTPLTFSSEFVVNPLSSLKLSYPCLLQNHVIMMSCQRKHFWESLCVRMLC